MKTPSVAPEASQVAVICGGLVVSVALVAGCASHTAPTDKLAASQSAIADALAAGAAELAPHELKLAQGKMELGKRWIGAKDHEPAHWLVEQAKGDAELATMKAMSARARKAAALMTEEFRAFNAKVVQRTY